MEFELLDNDDFPANVYDAVRRYLKNPRRQIQSWGDRVPMLAAATIFSLVAVEWVLSQRLAGGLGRGFSAVPSVIGVVLAIAIAESILVSAAGGIAVISGKTGNRRTAMGYMSLGLAPLLLVLPVTLLCEAAGLPSGIRTFMTALLCLKVFGSWKEVIEITFKLNRVQGLAAFYLAAGASALLGLLLVYIVAVGKIASAIG